MPGISSRAAAGRASLLVALSACGFGAISILVTFATDTGAPLLAVVSWRYLLATPVFVFLVWRGGWLRLDAAGVRVLVFGGAGQSVIALLTLTALRYIPAATISFLFYSYPAWVAIIARVRHSERLSPVRLLALALSLAGIFVMVGTPGSVVLHPIGVGLALVSAVLYAIYVPMMNELQKSLPSIVTAMYMSAGAAILLGTLAVTQGAMTAALHPTAWKAILGLAFVSTVASFVMFLTGLRVLGPLRTAIISTIEPFFTAVLGAWLLAQPLTLSTLLGGVLIAAAVVILQLKSGDNGSLGSGGGAGSPGATESPR